MAESTSSQKEEQNELTMCDVLEEEQELEEDANAVLGGSDDTNCSYDKGYVPRQALYACKTCADGEAPGGVCLACSYKCHDGHDIVELYTKRNFRCDCGNNKFPGKSCSLKPDKEPLNSKNKYNHNFKGLYCNCSRPYPDLEDDTPDEMIQCVMCEDWYHGRHIGSVVPDDYFEMICGKCMESHKFLYSYLNKFCYVNVSDDAEAKSNGVVKQSCSNDELKPSASLSPKKEHDPASETNVGKSSQKENVDVNDDTKENQAKSNGVVKQNSDDELKPPASLSPKKENEPASDTSVGESSQKENADGDKDIKGSIKEEIIECALDKLKIKPDGIVSGAAFWPENWRKELCRCSSCMDMYCENECDFLLNLDDTILAYEERGKSTNESQYDKGLTALSQLDRVKQMEAIRAYTSMKGHLKEYLREFANNKRTVCESDIKEFFDRMSKKQKTSNGVPHFCR